MASAIRELVYRPFDELLNTVRTDLKSYEQASDIDAGDLIKVAQRINYELGLKIYKVKETIVEIEHRRAKLPADFYQLKLAMLCHHYNEVYYPAGPGAPQWYEEQLPSTYSNPYLTTCPCWTIVSTGSQVEVTNCDGTKENVFFPAGTSKRCALSFGTPHPDGSLTYTTTSNCYNDPYNGGFTCTVPCVPCGAVTSPESRCGGIDADPWKQNLVRTACNGDINIKIHQTCSTPGLVRQYDHFERLYIVPSKEASAFCVNTQFRDVPNRAQIRGNFLETSIDCGKVYLLYMGALEDEDGNLLVLDHPKINNYYEWELKRTIFENLYMNGEDMVQRLQYATTQRDLAKADAFSIVNMPNYQTVVGQIVKNRDLYNQRFVEPLIGHWYNLWNNLRLSSNRW